MLQRSYPIEAISGAEHLEALSNRYAPLAATSRSSIDIANQLGDAGTADIFTEISRALDKALWFLEGHIQG